MLFDFFYRIAYHGFGRQHERCDGRGILQRRASNLGGIDYPGLHHVFVYFSSGVEAEVRILVVPQLIGDDCAIRFAVHYDLANRFFASAAHDVDAELLVAFEIVFTQCLRRPLQRNAAARYNAFLDCRASRMQCVFNAGLLLFHLRLGCRADFDDRHAACQFRQSLL